MPQKGKNVVIISSNPARIAALKTEVAGTEHGGHFLNIEKAVVYIARHQSNSGFPNLILVDSALNSGYEKHIKKLAKAALVLYFGTTKTAMTYIKQHLG